MLVLENGSERCLEMMASLLQHMAQSTVLSRDQINQVSPGHCRVTVVGGGGGRMEGKRSRETMVHCTADVNISIIRVIQVSTVNSCWQNYSETLMDTTFLVLFCTEFKDFG